MTTKEATKPETQWKKATGNFPPFLLLEVGEGCEGEITNVREVSRETKKKVKGKWVTENVDRLYYTLALSEKTVAHSGKKDESGKYPVMTFTAGEMVTLPQSGQLDTVLGRIAMEKEGLNPADKESIANFQKLIGVKLKLQRLPDGLMNKGPNQGNPVKNYNVEYALA